MHTTTSVPAPSAGRYAVAVVRGESRSHPHHEAHVYFEHGGYALLVGDTYDEARLRGHACGRTGVVPPIRRAEAL